MPKKCIIIASETQKPRPEEVFLASQRIKALIKEGVVDFVVFMPSDFGHEMLFCLHHQKLAGKRLKITVVVKEPFALAFKKVYAPLTADMCPADDMKAAFFKYAMAFDEVHFFAREKTDGVARIARKAQTKSLVVLNFAVWRDFDVLPLFVRLQMMVLRLRLKWGVFTPKGVEL